MLLFFVALFGCGLAAMLWAGLAVILPYVDLTSPFKVGFLLTVIGAVGITLCATADLPAPMGLSITRRSEKK